MSSGRSKDNPEYATFNEEKEAAESFEYYPIPPVTVEDVEIDIEDEFNGKVNVILSNGDRIRFEIKEKSVGEYGIDYDAHIFINTRKYEVDLGDVFQNGTYVADLTNFYIKNK
jgi:hypothetical protein